MREREKQIETHAYATRLTTIAKSVVATFGLIFFHIAPFATRDNELLSKNHLHPDTYRNMKPLWFGCYDDSYTKRMIT